MSDRRSKSAASGRAKTIKRTDSGTAEIPLSFVTAVWLWIKAIPRTTVTR